MARAPRREAAARGKPGAATTNRRLASIGLAALACFGIATLPASLLGGMLDRFGLSETGFSGTIWSGAAHDATWKGAPLGELSWRLRPLALLRARLAAAIELSRPDGSASATVAARPDGTLDISDARFDLPVELFAQIPSGMARGWHGRMSGALSELRLVAAWPAAAAGRIDLTSLVMPQLGADTIGSFAVVLPDPRAGSAASPGVTARVTDTGGPLSLDALLTLAAGRSFQLEGTVMPRDSAPRGLVRSLQYLGPADASGRRQFGVSGTF